MTAPSALSRRSFLQSTLAVSAALAAPAVAAPSKRFPIIAFSKPFQHLSHADCAEFVAEIGWDGIECPVRPKGQVEPEAAADELPALVAALKRRGKDIQIGTTNITSVDTPHAERVLRALAAVGVKRYRMGYWRYSDREPMAKLHAEVRAQLKDLAALNAELGIQGGYQNHSGRQYVGAPIWDIFNLLQELDPKHVGMIYDIGHSTVEGGYSWPIEARLVQDQLTAVYVKDFRWEKTDKGWKAQWCPLGEGMVDRKFFQMLTGTGYAGPIAQHHEYELSSPEEMRRAMKADLKVLRGWLK